jgi:5'-nucleotidase
MQPFGNSLVVMSFNGAQLKALLESQEPSDDRQLLQPSAGLTYTWQTDAPKGDRIRDLRLDGKPIDAASTYGVTVNSFLAEGGDGFTYLRDAATTRKGGGQDLDAMIAYVTAATRIPVAEPRIKRLP